MYRAYDINHVFAVAPMPAIRRKCVDRLVTSPRLMGMPGDRIFDADGLRWTPGRVDGWFELYAYTASGSFSTGIRYEPVPVSDPAGTMDP
jgi:hypothetical protein